MVIIDNIGGNRLAPERGGAIPVYMPVPVVVAVELDGQTDSFTPHYLLLYSYLECTALK